MTALYTSLHGWAVFWSVYRNARRKRHGAGAASIKFAIFGAQCCRCISIRKPWRHPLIGWPWTLFYGRLQR